LLIDTNESVTRLVFLGPSLPPHNLTHTLPADTRLLPPIKRGDVDLAVERFPNAKTIGIVDGEFFQSFSISPVEILRSMDRGKHFWGSSSIGALRATELSIYGMVGVGTIFEMFAAGEIDADDEVAMTYDPSTLVATSEPLVNIRIALTRAHDAGHISEKLMKLALNIARNLYYPDRTYRAVLSGLRAQVSPEEFTQLECVFQAQPNAKGEDAWKLLKAMDILEPLPS
jgi:hypothetical protein